MFFFFRLRTASLLCSPNLIAESRCQRSLAASSTYPKRRWESEFYVLVFVKPILTSVTFTNVYLKPPFIIKRSVVPCYSAYYSVITVILQCYIINHDSICVLGSTLLPDVPARHHCDRTGGHGGSPNATSQAE